MARAGVAAVGGAVALSVLAELAILEREGWGVLAASLAFSLVTGLVAGGLVFGLLLPRAVRNRREATGSVGAGFASVILLTLFFTPVPAIVGAGAVTLGLAALERPDLHPRARLQAWTGLVTGLAAVGAWLAFVVFALTRGGFGGL